MGCLKTCWKVLTRRKILTPTSVQDSQLARVLTTFDLTALGVGSTLGVGVYVIAGKVAKETAGPSVILSFLIAAIVSVFAGLCYAEFGARAPRAGSAYIYSYVCVGEFIAFWIGWNLILEYVIGSASVARGLSGYLDTLINDTMQNAFIDIAPINVSFMAKYFDFFAFGISILLSIALAFGMKESSMVNNIITTLNIGVVLFVVILGSTKADVKNWSIHVNSTNSTDGMGDGGFFPFGIEGMIKGAATCFYGFVGFDCIATTGEEVKNPKRAIPISIILSLFIIFLAYFGISTVVTLMVPYYAQDINVPIPHAFEAVGWDWAKWVVAIGGMFGLFASLFGAMLPLPRIIYAMASDSLIFQFLGRVNERFKTPVVGTLLSGLLTGLMAALFDLKQLVDMMSIGTLLAYTIVAASVLLLRYERDQKHRYVPVQTNSDSDNSDVYTENRMPSGSSDEEETTNLVEVTITTWSIFKQIFNCGRYMQPTKLSQRVATTMVCIYCLLCILIGLSAIYLREPISKGEIWAIVLTSVIIFFTVVTMMSLATQPTSNAVLSFKVPWVPLIPALSILANIYLMLMLDKMTWIRFGVWMAVGLFTYYFSLRPLETKNHSINLNANGRVNYGFVYGESEEVVLTSNTPKQEDVLTEKVKKKARAPLPPEIKVLEEFDIMLQEVSVSESQTETTSVLESFKIDNNEKKSETCLHNDDDDDGLKIKEFLQTEEIDRDDDGLQMKDCLSTEENLTDTNEEKDLGETDLETEKENVEIVTPPPTPDLSQDETESKQETPPPTPESEDVNIPSPPKPPPIPIFITPTPPSPPVRPTTPAPVSPKTLPLRPTSSDLSKVKLKPTQVKKIEKTEELATDDTNISKGDPRYEDFRNKLNGVLKNQMPMVQKPRPATIAPSVPQGQNPDVLADNINISDSKSKLDIFLRRNPSALTQSQAPTIQKNKSVNDLKAMEVPKIEEEPKPVSKPPLKNISMSLGYSFDRMEHRQKMDNVFKSIRAKKSDEK